jgi:hypothetical protein
MESPSMESRFKELAPTDLSDEVFFNEVFLDYIRYVYPSKETSIEDLSRLRYLFNQRGHEQHLRDKLEHVLYHSHKRQQEIAIAEKIILKQKIERMNEQIQGLNQRIDCLENKGSCTNSF